MEINANKLGSNNSLSLQHLLADFKQSDVTKKLSTDTRLSKVQSANDLNSIKHKSYIHIALVLTCLVARNFCSMDLLGIPLTFFGETLQLIDDGSDL